MIFHFFTYIESFPEILKKMKPAKQKRCDGNTAPSFFTRYGIANEIYYRNLGRVHYIK